MDVLKIRGGRPLHGDVCTGGAKNAVLPVMAASILCGERIILRDCPLIADVSNMIEIMRTLGCDCEQDGHTIVIDSSRANSFAMPEMLSKKLRSSIFMMGSILARFGKANVTFPGGCEIGQRPIDLHLKGLRALGVDIREEGDMIYCDGAHLHGGEIRLDFPSVGATENVMMAAALAPGETVIYNAAREPEIEDLQNFINAMGGDVSGAGTHTLTIRGVTSMHGCEYTPIPDRIVAGTLLAAAAITDGDVTVHNVRSRDLGAVLEKLIECGCNVEVSPDSLGRNDMIHISRNGKLRAFKISTLPHPGFPTDMQAQMMALACLGEGTSVISETVFERRMAHVESLNAMGADVTLQTEANPKNPTAFVKGVNVLHGARVYAKDLRGGAALVMAGLAADGETTVDNVRYIDRGYERLEDMLRGLGADIERFDDGRVSL